MSQVWLYNSCFLCLSFPCSWRSVPFQSMLIQVSLVCTQCPRFPSKVPHFIYQWCLFRCLSAGILPCFPHPWQSFFKDWVYVYPCFACVYVCAPHTHLMPEEVRRGHWFSWTSWNYRRCESSGRCWAVNPTPLQEQQGPLIAEPAFEICDSLLKM